ncbi:MAG: hypothetical protein GY859_35155, partial [Desulfobacterales bacterium]|nr:hypothetical protein [Desulfobacterales bacterium]
MKIAPETSPPKKETGDGAGPTADVTDVPFRRLRVGGVDEFVGREEAMAWLRENLIEKPVNNVAVASMHGAGGMGKTFLAHVFAAEHRGEIPFLEIHLGERSPFEAGIELLEKLDVDARKINTPEKLRIALRHLYSKSGGIIILDDVRDEGARILLPESIKWRALITTRSKTLAESLTPKVRPLESLRPHESMALLRNVLEKDFAPAWKEDYQDLADFLAHRPYGIRLAAESMKSGLTHISPRALLDALASHEVSTRATAGGGAKTLENLWPLLDHCLTQLETISPFARELLDSLAVCSDEGMELPFFLEWQKEFASPDQVEHELTLARDLGLLLVEAPVSTQLAEGMREPRIRLHTDLLKLLRRSPLTEQAESLHHHLRLTLVENPGNMESKRPL